MLLGLLACTDGPEPTHPEPEGPCAPTPGEVCTVVGAGVAGSNGLMESDPLEVWLFSPSSVAADPDGRLVVADWNNNLVRRLDDDGLLRTVVGNGAHAYAYDAVDCLETGLENPSDVALRPDGTMLLYEQHGARILRVDTGGWLTVYAGDPLYPGYDDYRGDGGPALGAGMTQGWGLTVADDGTLYFAEPFIDVIRSISPDGTIDTLAGQGDPSLGHAGAGFVDGVGTDARFFQPHGVHWDDGFVYVADTGNHAIRRIDTATREVLTIAGLGVAGSTGDGGPALAAALSAPMGLHTGPDGTLYVADTGNHAVRRIEADGTLHTVAGRLGTAGFAGDGGPPQDALLSSPQDVLVLDGDVYVADTFNHRVRVIVPE